MQQDIISNLDSPRQLEKLYRDNKTVFKREFNAVYADIQQHTTAQIWHERLNFENEGIGWGTSRELMFVVGAALVAGIIAKIPQIAGIDEEYFFSRHLGFVVLPLLMIYFGWKQKTSTKHWLIVASALIISLIFINLLPKNPKSDTLILACMHLPLFLWAVLGSVFVGPDLKNFRRRLDFLRYNGDLVVMSALILISGGLLTAVTLGLFSLIGLNINEFYGQYVIVMGLAAVPIVGTYLVQVNPQLVNQVSPVIAKVFTPLVLVTLAVYLGAVIYTGKDPYNDREFLLIFNLLLIGVMAIILFSVTETSKNAGGKIELLMLLSLAVLTILVNGVALSAIIFRISEWGITPNRLAVLGSNALILSNLLWVTYRLYKATRNDEALEEVENSIAAFLP
ncbi:MAG: hypothetical protein MUE30_10890, partial [Spirosomaceae bacterium]|nr:hypothetical protein [Spirosomataceae bacterium]